VRPLRLLVTLPGFPRRPLSRLTGCLARRRLPPALRRRLWPLLARAFGIERQAVPGAWEDYPSFLDLFTRPLPEGSRPLPPGYAWLSPADGRLLERAPAAPEGSWWIKGVPYSTVELLPGSDPRDWLDHQVLQIYLAPRDYHRFHAPCALTVRRAVALEGGLQPVDPGLARRSLRVLARNRRVFLDCRSAAGERLGLLFVGALNVGGIRFTFDASLGGHPFVAGSRRYDPPLAVEAGQELGRFELGSTVLLFAPRELRPLRQPGETCRAREPLLAGGREQER